MLRLSGTIKGGTWSFFSHCARQLLVTWLRRTVNHFKAFNARKNAFKIINVDLGIKLRHMILLTVGIAEEKTYHWRGKTILLLHSSIFMNASHIITCIDIPDVPVNQVLLQIKSDIKCSSFSMRTSSWLWLSNQIISMEEDGIFLSFWADRHPWVWAFHPCVALYISSC